jgi:metal-responsive CopG/Arc/MetJ family transcriptional regulator
MSSPKQRITITIDTSLLQEVDRFSNNRSAVVEEALRLWRKQQIENQLRSFYQNRSQSNIEEESLWADQTQEAAMICWEDSDPSRL